MATDDSVDRERANRKLLDSARIARDWDHSDALRWRRATMEERGAALLELCRFTDAVIRSRGFGVVKPPLPPSPLRRPPR
ncbi:MAG: hypothetical protein ACR2HN_08515 [Tepidiformaceae bacterium]